MMAAVFAVIIGGAVIGSSVHALKKPEVGAEMRNPGSKPAPIVPGNPSNPGNSGNPGKNSVNNPSAGIKTVKKPRHKGNERCS